jgi:hypothetical protein
MGTPDVRANRDNKFLGSLKASMGGREDDLVTIPTEVLRRSIGAAADLAKLWFESRSQLVQREQFEIKGALSDTGEGAVYAYFHKDNHAVYVGQTGRRIKARLYDQTGVVGQQCASINSLTKWTELCWSFF